MQKSFSSLRRKYLKLKARALRDEDRRFKEFVKRIVNKYNG